MTKNVTFFYQTLTYLVHSRILKSSLVEVGLLVPFLPCAPNNLLLIMMGGIKWPSVYTFSFHQGEIMVLLQRGPALVIFSCYYLCIFILWNYYHFFKFYITQGIITIYKLLLVWTLPLYSYLINILNKIYFTSFVCNVRSISTF